MHPTDLPHFVQEHLRARHGRLHRFDRLDPARTALAIVDMQRMFCAPGALLEVPAAREIVPAINRMAAAIRAAGGTVAWVRSAFPPSERDWRVMFEAVMPPEFGAKIRAGLQRGSPDYALFDGLAPEPGDIEADKDRFSAFLPGAVIRNALSDAQDAALPPRSHSPVGRTRGADLSAKATRRSRLAGCVLTIPATTDSA